MPKVVFWNLNARSQNFPAQASNSNVALVSGFSPSILKSLLSGKPMDPVNVMLDTLNVKRYEAIQ
jgi:hypothetical protein